jgi:hypothetical protein
VRFSFPAADFAWSAPLSVWLQAHCKKIKTLHRCLNTDKFNTHTKIAKSPKKEKHHSVSESSETNDQTGRWHARSVVWGALMAECCLPSLEQHRNRGDLIETFKIMRGLDKVPCSKFSSPAVVRHRGHSDKPFKSRSRLNIRKKSRQPMECSPTRHHQRKFNKCIQEPPWQTRGG